MESAVGTFFARNETAGMDGQAGRFRISRQKENSWRNFFFASSGAEPSAISETRPRGRLRKMLPRQGDPDANNHARQKTDEETKPGRVAHRALTQVENSRRFVFVHGSILNRARQSASRRNHSSGSDFFLQRLGRRPESGIDIGRVVRAFVAVRSASASDHELHRIRQ